MFWVIGYLAIGGVVWGTSIALCEKDGELSKDDPGVCFALGLFWLPVLVCGTPFCIGYFPIRYVRKVIAANKKKNAELNARPEVELKEVDKFLTEGKK